MDVRWNGRRDAIRENARWGSGEEIEGVRKTRTLYANDANGDGEGGDDGGERAGGRRGGEERRLQSRTGPEVDERQSGRTHTLLLYTPRVDALIPIPSYT